MQLFRFKKGPPSEATEMFHDDAGPRGPFVAMDVHEGTGRVRDKDKGGMMAALDTFGGVKITVWGHDTDALHRPPLSAYAKVAAAHVSGQSRAVSLSSYKENNDLLPACFLASSCSVRMFAVNISTSPAAATSIKLILLSKVLVNFHPEYLMPFLKRGGVRSAVEKDRRPDILVADREGNLAFAQMDTDAPECLQLSSSPLSRVPSSVVACSRAELIAMITHKGQLAVYHSSSGIKMPPFTASAATAASCLASADTPTLSLLAVGSRCGRVSIFNAVTSQLLRTFPFPPVMDGSDKDKDKGGSAGSKKRGGLKAKPSQASDEADVHSGGNGSGNSAAVLSMIFINEGCALVAAYDDGGVAIHAIQGGSTILNSSSSSVHPILVQCHGDENVFGVVRGSEIEVIRVTLRAGVSFGHTNPLQVVGTSLSSLSLHPSSVEEAMQALKIDTATVPITTTVFRSTFVFMESGWLAEDETGPSRNLDRIHANSKQTIDDGGSTRVDSRGGVHMIKDSDNDLIHFVAVGASKKKGIASDTPAIVSYFYSGSIATRYSGVRVDDHSSIHLYQRVKIGSSFVTISFTQTTAAVSLPEAVFLLDLKALLLSPLTPTPTLIPNDNKSNNDYKVVPLTFNEFKDATQILLSCSGHTVGGTSMSGSVLSLVNDTPGGESSHPSLFVCKNHKTMFLKIDTHTVTNT